MWAAVGGCDGVTDVMWQLPQRLKIQGDRAWLRFSRRYSYSPEVWEQVRALKRHEGGS